MLENQTELKKNVGKDFATFKRLLPDVAEAYEHLPAEVYSDGAVSGKNKRLMALTAAVVGGCRSCILYQTDNALALGASVEELLEACAVAISLGGTMAAGQATRVVRYLSEQGLVEDRAEETA